MDLDHPFFRPLWRRILVFGIAAGWSVVEFAGGALFWGGLFAALALWSGWSFFVAGPYANSDTGDDE